MKKLISIAIVIAMMLSMVLMVIPASAAEPASDTPVEATVPSDYQPVAGSWPITKPEDLYLAFHNPVHLTGDITIPADYKVGQDLVDYETKNATLDGCGYSIIYEAPATEGDETAHALFNGTAGSITVKNLNVKGVMNVTSSDHVGVICKYGGNLTLNNVVVDVDVTVKGAKGAVGGVLGKFDWNQTADLDNVHFTGSLNVEAATSMTGVGGIIGAADGAITMTNCTNSGDITNEDGSVASNVGGLIGRGYDGSSKITLTNCANSGDISIVADAPSSVGGLLGTSYSKSGQNAVTITNCSNSGDISVTTSATDYNNQGIGGLVGRLGYTWACDSNYDSYIIKENTNNGSVSISASGDNAIANAHLGGIIGTAADFDFRLTVLKCTNNGAVTYNNGSAEGTQTTGGIIGSTSNVNWGVTIEDCANTAAITGPIAVGGILGGTKPNRSMDLYIKYCSNYGDVVATAAGAVSGAGGIVGDLTETKAGANLKFDDCFNAGDVTSAGQYVGGIIGYWNAIQPKTGFAWLGRCINIGNVTATSDDAVASGIIGLIIDDSNVIIDDCANIGAISGETASPITAATAATVSASENAYLASSISGTDTTGYGELTTASDIFNRVKEYLENYSDEDKALIADEIIPQVIDEVEAAIEGKENEYSAENWTAIEDAITAVEATLGEDSTLDQKIEAVDDLFAAVEAKLDYSELQAAIEEAQEALAGDEDAYTIESWAALEEALETAQGKLTSRSQTEIDTAAEELRAAILALDEPNYTALNDAIEDASALDDADYSPESWAALEEALETAQGKLTSKSQTEIDAAANALGDAIDALENINVNYDALNAAINAAKALIETDYSVEDWTAITNAIATAEDKLQSRNQGVVDEAAQTLNGVVSSKTKLDRTALQAAITLAGTKDEESYTVDTWEALEEALAAAQSALASRVQSEITAAASALNAAIGDLAEPNYDALNAAIGAAEALDEDDYTANTWEALEEALAYAENVLESREQADIDAAAEALETAIGNLINPDTHDHRNVEVVDRKSASCTESGYTGDSVCMDCGKVIIEGEVIPTLAHKYGKWTASKTAGKHEHKCTCGASETADCDWDEGEITTPATETEKGVKLYTCTVCGAEKTEDIPMLEAEDETDEATDEVTDEVTDEETDGNDEQSEPVKEGGCGSAVASTVVAIVATLGMGVSVLKKRK